MLVVEVTETRRDILMSMEGRLEGRERRGAGRNGLAWRRTWARPRVPASRQRKGRRPVSSRRHQCT